MPREDVRRVADGEVRLGCGLSPDRRDRRVKLVGSALEQAATKRGGYPSLVVHARRCS